MKVEEHVSRERSGPERQWKRYQHRVYRMSEEAGFAFHATFPFRVCLIGILWIRVDRATIASVAMATQICEVMNRARQFCSRRAHAVKVESACGAGVHRASELMTSPPLRSGFCPAFGQGPLTGEMIHNLLSSLGPNERCQFGNARRCHSRNRSQVPQQTILAF